MVRILAEVGAPADIHLGVVTLRAVNKVTDVRRWHRLRRGLAKRVQVSGQKDGRIRRRGEQGLGTILIQVGFMLALDLLPERFEGGDAKVDLIRIVLLRPKPFPRVL
ncbi:MAG TPA: hypothetical protein VG271_15880, partial [Beijerinckiaceae bacterium]|nr:hypothetical protein [Beijerinckiaceae bacterium]